MSNTTRWYGWQTKEGEPCIFTSTNSDCDTSPSANLTITKPFSLPPDMRQTTSELYFDNEVLRKSGSLSELGNPSWWMLLCLGVTWLVNFLCLFKGIKTSGKVVYFTATFPYIIIVILLVRAATLEGAHKVPTKQESSCHHHPGDRLLHQPNLVSTWRVEDLDGRRRPDSLLPQRRQRHHAHSRKLQQVPQGWFQAIFLGALFFCQNIVVAVVFICLANCLTSFVAGFAIFGTLGYLAHLLGQDVTDVVQGGPTLAFVTYPDLVRCLT